MKRELELLAPAGNWDCVRAAVANGADAVYFGLPRFNARLRADNMTEEELPEVVQFCHRHGVKAYVTFNTLVFTDELEAAGEYLRLLNRSGVDALIVQDPGLVRLAAELVPELPIHASTQMTITSPEGIRFARDLGIRRVVLARELSLRELAKFDPETELEVFVHGALCVAYSGQCLTSEALGQRSANRGECAQACRMPYELIVDGSKRDLGDRRYLLSPQDLAAVDDIPALIERGVVSFKIEGRLKSPEYVAAVTQVYRRAIDAALGGAPLKRALEAKKAEDRYQLEMTFSRGLFSGWIHGVNHQELVTGRFGKKRGPFAGYLSRIGKDFVVLDEPMVELRPGDGVVFDTGGETDEEQGGRIYRMDHGRLYFKHGHINFTALKPGDRLWKTDDPALMGRLRSSFSGSIPARQTRGIDLRVSGAAGRPMRVEVPGRSIRAESGIPLEAARTAPLTHERLVEHLGRLGGAGYHLGTLVNDLEGGVILPISELNRLRRAVVAELEQLQSRPESGRSVREVLSEVSKEAPRPVSAAGLLSVLCRTMGQIEAVLDAGASYVMVDFEDIRRYKDAVSLVRAKPGCEVLLATPRIQKAGEQGFFKLIESADPDGVLVRNLGAIDFFAGKALKKIGDFSLNVANPLTAALLMKRGFDRLTISYDLDIQQVLSLLRESPRGWFEITLHQHMPMFHMEHCVFAAFLSNGTDHTNCGRPCDVHTVHVRDRVGIEHPVRADVGCRNTVFNAVAQTGAHFYSQLHAAGLRHFRVELLEQTAQESTRIIRAYQALLAGETGGESLWKSLKAASQLGVTRGTYRESARAGK